MCYEGSPELISTQLSFPRPPLFPQSPCSAPVGSAVSFSLSWAPWTPLFPEKIRAEGGGVSAEPVQEAEGWVYPGQQPGKSEHIIKRLYLLVSALRDKSSQCCSHPVTSVWALCSPLPGSILSLEAESAAQLQLVLSMERTDFPSPRQASEQPPHGVVDMPPIRCCLHPGGICTCYGGATEPVSGAMSLSCNSAERCTLRRSLPFLPGRPWRWAWVGVQEKSARPQHWTMALKNPNDHRTLWPLQERP